MNEFNSNSIEARLRHRKLSEVWLSEVTDIAVHRLEEILKGEREPSIPQLRKISEALSVPITEFFTEAPSDEYLIPDFRHKNIEVSPFSKKLLRSIERTRSILGALAEFSGERPKIIGSYRGELTKTEARKLSVIYRAKANIDKNVQTGFNNSNEFYRYCRSVVESWGIFVFQDQFDPSEDGSGYVLIEEFSAAIVINTKNQSKARRNFTLWHEFAHILLGKEGISDPSKNHNSIESFCNAFAAYLLAPKELVRWAFSGRNLDSLSKTAIYQIAQSIFVSQDMLLIRAEQLDILPKGYRDRWLAQFGDRHPDSFEQPRRSSDPTPPPPAETKQTIYGSKFFEACARAVSQGGYDAIDIYRVSGLKPKYLKQLIEVPGL